MNFTFPILLDGATGTRLQREGLSLGACTEEWVLAHPEKVIAMQRAYIDAGSNAVYAPTFGANRIILGNHGIREDVTALNKKIVAVSRQAAGDRAMVAGDISSTGGMLIPMGDMTFEDLYEIYLEQARGLAQAGVDLFAIETMSNMAEVRAAILAVKAVSDKPVLVTVSVNEKGRTMMGTDVCAALAIVQGMGADAFGLNCSVGPKDILAQLKRLRPMARIPLIAKPNAGLPESIDGKTVYNVDAEEFASFVPALAEAGVCFFGGCCGSDESYIAAVKQALAGVPMQAPAPEETGLLPLATEKDAFYLAPDAAPEQVFACDEELEDNLYDLEEEELFGIEITSEADAALFAEVQYAVKNPLCFLCEDAALLEQALRAYQGRALYRGGIAPEKLAPLKEKYGLVY